MGAPNTADGVKLALLVNSYSFIALGLIVLLIIAFLTVRLFGLQRAVVVVVVTFVLLVVFQLMASTEANSVSSPEEFNNVLMSGKPVLIELYSNF